MSADEIKTEARKLLEAKSKDLVDRLSPKTERRETARADEYKRETAEEPESRVQGGKPGAERTTPLPADTLRDLIKEAAEDQPRTGCKNRRV